MAIHLPRQRNGFGIPARYMDLSSAGLRYTPPGEWRYDSYDVEGDVATLYAQDVDLADYQYNADHGNAQVLPEGASAIDCTGKWKIVSGALFYKMQVTETWVNTGLGGGFTSVGGFYYIDGGHNSHAGTAVHACKGGRLCYVSVDEAYNFIQYNFSGDTATNWLTVNGSVAADDSIDGPAYIYGTSLTGHAMRAFWDGAPIQSIGGILTPYTNVQVAGTRAALPAATTPGLNILTVRGLILERDSGTLFDLGGLSALTDLGTGWTAISGHARTVIITSEDPYTYTRMYGIKAGNLYSLRKSGSASISWTATLIDDSGDWHRVQFIEPDVAVAIRRVELSE